MHLKRPTRLLAAVALTGVLAACAAPPGGPAAPSTDVQSWTGSWAAAMQRPSAGFTPNWAEQGFANTTLRQVVRLTAGGPAVRIRLSNQYGTGPLNVAGATIGLSAGGASVTPGSLRELPFQHSTSAIIQPAETLSATMCQCPPSRGSRWS